MSESQPSSGAQAAQGETVPELEPKEFEQLAEMVYKLMRDEYLLELERRGAASVRERR
jgi:hypothetical protein